MTGGRERDPPKRALRHAPPETLAGGEGQGGAAERDNPETKKDKSRCVAYPYTTLPKTNFKTKVRKQATRNQGRILQHIA